LTYLQTLAVKGDAELVSVALQGGPEDFAEIVRRYKDAVFGVALSRLRNFHDAEDLTQATFLEAYVGLERLRDPSRLGPWLRTIAIHRSINHVKRRAPSVELEAADEPAATAPSPQEEVEIGELRERVMGIIGRLGKTHRETVTLFYIGDYSLAEVAAIQEVPLGTVKRRLHEARARLKEDMLEMVEEVLQDNVPDEALADRVFEAIAAYPRSGVPDRRSTSEVVAKFGRVGKEGFLRAYRLPHSHSRLRAVQYVGPYYGNQFGEDGPPREFSVRVLIEALNDRNKRVRRAAADRLLYARKVMDEEDWIREVLPRLLALTTHESKHTRRMAVGKLDIWVRWTGTPGETVRRSLSLEDICRAMAQETDTEVLWRFKHLIAHYLEVCEG